MNNFYFSDFQMDYSANFDNQYNNGFFNDSFDKEINDENDLNAKDYNTEKNNSFFDIKTSEKYEAPNLFILNNKIGIDGKFNYGFEPLNDLLHIQNTEPSTKPKLGRKSKNSNEKGNHTREKEDNLIRKAKVIIKKALINFINSKLNEIFSKNEKISINGKEYNIKLLNIKQNKVTLINVSFNQQMLNDTIKDFFSEKISGNFSNYPDNFNELLIKKIYEMKNCEKITCIFEKTFLECLKFFRMDKDIFKNPKYSCLEGLEKNFLGLEKKLLSKGYDEAYIKKLFKLINNFEIVYRKKKARKPRKTKSNYY